MDYDDIAAHFLTPTGTPQPEPQLPDTPARRLRDAVESIATIGWWSRPASESASELGLDFFGAYVWGRAASLGADVSPSVVISSFGVFEPTTIEDVLTAARSKASHEDVLAARQSGAIAGLVAATHTVDDTVVETLGSRLLAALAELDGTARPLFSALRALPVPTDPYGTLWRAAELVREHRGDGHLAACVAAGLDAIDMNILTELWLGYPFGEYSATRGFSPTQLSAAAAHLRERGWLNTDDSLTGEGRKLRDAIEHGTDTSQRSLIEQLGGNLASVISSGRSITSAVLTACAAPADARKRAAG